MMTDSEDYHFTTRTTKHDEQYLIDFLNIPKLSAQGELYEEAEYYAYRVLADYLIPLKTHPEKIAALTAQEPTNKGVNEHSFLSVITVPLNLDPHKMQSQFVIPRDSAENAHAEINKITRLINEDSALK
ncbi:hypothetical protein [Loigolactobacillus iwatensis]|uniref:hypothetical protein n=1 Tax=Loigolactobacillus iwatensis TaxID=1267156 RepID=UPI000F7E1736|nr:hypothetical protein [Loigolactobacillus iwatensis]